jgi:23S rRNA (cytosine1962-C5)-methyltransferase
MNEYKKITLKHKKEESLKRLHPWIFSGAIQKKDDGIAEGDTVNVYAADNTYLATGHYQIGSIAVRILSFSKNIIDHAFWTAGLKQAASLRQALNFHTGNTATSIYRLVHGEGDNLPGLIIDIYGHTAVLQAHSPGMHHARHQITQALIDTLGNSIQSVYYKSENTLPYMAKLQPEDGYLHGSKSDNIAMENGLRFTIDWQQGQKTGFFIDQRENRSLLESYSLNRDVLNMFSYTGGFSVYAMRGGARKVHSVDSSARALEAARENVALNFPNDSRHETFDQDAFRYLATADGQYDLIILDPPAFAKHREALRNALQGYRNLNAAAIRKIRPGGIIFTFSCSQAVSRENFRTTIFSAAAQAGRKVQILHQLTQPADHPISIYHPEGEYLKGLVLHVE